MKTIIAGSRNISHFLPFAYRIVCDAVEASGFDVTHVISGNARGVDRLGEFWASRHKVPCSKIPADWRKHGRIAGFRRNEEMANTAEALIAVWDGRSPGTRHMIRTAERKGLRVFVWTVHSEAGSLSREEKKS